MLKSVTLTAALTGAMLVAAVPANALSVVFAPGAAATNLQGTTIVEDFESFALGAFPGGYRIQQPPSNGTGAVPAFGSSGKFLSVQNGGSYTFNVSPAAQVVSFIIGSLDGFNHVDLNFETGPVVTLTGAGVVGGSPANGNQVLPNTNGRVFYDAQGLDRLVSITFRSTGTAFEIDNISTAVPEPETWGMMLLTAGIAGYGLRRRRRQISFG